jgi:hypothetical protein
MNRYQKNRYEMFLRVQKCLNENVATWENNPYLAGRKTELDNIIASITAKAERISDYSPKSPVKMEIREQLVSSMLRLRGGMLLQAALLNDRDMKSKYESIKRTLNLNAPQTDFMNKVNQMLTTVSQYESDLVAFGITPEMVTEARALADEFSTYVVTPADAQNRIRALKAEISEEIKAGLRLLKDAIDPVVEILSPDTVFFQWYERARSIYDVRARYTKKTDEPAEGADNSEADPQTE